MSRITEIVDDVIAKTNTNTTDIATIKTSKLDTAIMHNATSKTTPADNDEFAILDSANTFNLKKFTWANFKSIFATLISPTFTGTVVLPSTTSIGNISDTEISYLDGVTSSIQSQLSSKLETTSISLSSNGYMRLSNGFILQWGVSSLLSNNTYETINFPIAFPTACRSATSSWYSEGDDTTDVFVGISTLSTSQIRVTLSAAAGTHRVLWIAIGH